MLLNIVGFDIVEFKLPTRTILSLYAIFDKLSPILPNELYVSP